VESLRLIVLLVADAVVENLRLRTYKTGFRCVQAIQLQFLVSSHSFFVFGQLQKAKGLLSQHLYKICRELVFETAWTCLLPML